MKEIRVWKLRTIFGGYRPILFRKVRPPVDPHTAFRRFERFLGPEASDNWHNDTYRGSGPS